MDDESEEHSCTLNLDSAPLEVIQRTEQYVIHQAKVWETELRDACVLPKTKLSHSYSISPSQLIHEAKPFLTDQNNAASQSPHLTPQQPRTYKDECVQESHKVRFGKAQNTPVQQFRCVNDNGRPTSKLLHMSPVSNNDNSNVIDFVKFFAHRELVATGFLLQFNDRPLNCRARKRSFQNATQDLDLTPSE